MDGQGAILTVSPYGGPRYLCDSCDGDFSIITSDESEEQIASAIDRVKSNLIKRNVEDKSVLKAVEQIINSKDETLEEVPEQLPEELLETEEDKVLSERETEQNKKIDKIFNWITTGVAVAFLAIVIFWIIKTFL